MYENNSIITWYELFELRQFVSEVFKTHNFTFFLTRKI